MRLFYFKIRNPFKIFCGTKPPSPAHSFYPNEGGYIQSPYAFLKGLRLETRLFTFISER